MSYDPDLKVAVLEITEILEKYDIGATVTLTSKTHAEFFYRFADWSVIQFVKENKYGSRAIRIKSKRSDFDSKEEQRKKTADSVGSVAQYRDIAAQTFTIFDKIYKELEKFMEIDHKPFSDFTPHSETVN